MYDVFVLSVALRDTLHTPMARCSLFVLKVPLNSNRLTNYCDCRCCSVSRSATGDVQKVARVVTHDDKTDADRYRVASETGNTQHGALLACSASVTGLHQRHCGPDTPVRRSGQLQGTSSKGR